MSQPNATRPEPPLPTPARRRRDREAWVGLFAITGVLITVAALFLLTDPSVFRGRYVLTTTVEDAAGIRRGDPVRMQGVHIGRVKGFDLSHGEVVIAMEVDKAYRVPRDSRVRVRSTGILGDKVADVIPGTSEVAASGGDRLLRVEGAARPADGLAAVSEDVLERVQALLSDKTVRSIEASSVELSELLRGLSAGVTEQRASLSALSATLQQSAANIEQATGPELMRSVERVDALTKRMEELPPRIEVAVGSLDRASKGMEAVVGRVQRGEGTLGKLLREDGLYLNANQAAVSVQRAARELGLLSEDIRRNPKRYVHLSLF